MIGLKDQVSALTRKNELLISAASRNEEQLEAQEADIVRKDKELRSLRSKAAKLEVDVQEAQELMEEASRSGGTEADAQA